MKLEKTNNLEQAIKNLVELIEMDDYYDFDICIYNNCPKTTKCIALEREPNGEEDKHLYISAEGKSVIEAYNKLCDTVKLDYWQKELEYHL